MAKIGFCETLAFVSFLSQILKNIAQMPITYEYDNSTKKGRCSIFKAVLSCTQLFFNS